MYVVGGLKLGLGTLDDGTYTLVGSADDEPFACSVEISGDHLTATCTEGAEGISVEDLWRGTFWFLGAPCVVTLTVSRDGAALVSGSLRPHWTWDEPNGVGCGWVPRASADLGDFAL
jgi:hypothetical protein